ncbi:MAG TPA: alpha/beta hydrolase [Candidatus Saccharimonadales bacterium]|nr:alpha/beta hydrolase [Candidatus Saccharimonadales bacterium]
MKLRWLACLALLLISATGCIVVKGVGMAFLYKKAELPLAQVHLDIPYREGAASPENRLDLFTPAGTNWPILIFVHGGGWTEGDKSLKVAGDDVYGNIGRFYAEHGIGVAVINYRLLPHVHWQEQISDVAHATAWVYSHVAQYGGNPARLFLCGHSAGAQLVDRVALDPAPLNEAGRSTAIVRGVISVSGAGLDLKDEETYALGESREYYAQRFGTGTNPGDWQRAASPVAYIHPGAPPFLILYAGGETKPLIRQSQRFSQALTQAGVKNKIIVVPGQSHARIVLTLSRDDKTAGSAILNFIETPE